MTGHCRCLSPFFRYLFRNFFKRVCFSADKDTVRAVICQGHRYGFADPSAGTGNQRDPVLQRKISHIFLSNLGIRQGL
jgi:hypothetical protein